MSIIDEGALAAIVKQAVRDAMREERRAGATPAALRDFHRRRTQRVDDDE